MCSNVGCFSPCDFFYLHVDSFLFKLETEIPNSTLKMYNMLVFLLHRAFYLDKSNLNPTLAPKAAFIDKVCTHTCKSFERHVN